MIRKFKDFFTKKKIDISEFDSLIDDDFTYGFYVYFWTDKEESDYKNGLGYQTKLKITDENDLVSKIKNKELIFKFTHLIFKGLDDDGNSNHVMSYEKLTKNLNSELTVSMSKGDIGKIVDDLISIWEDNGIYSSDIIIEKSHFGICIGVENISSKCLEIIIKRFLK